MNGVPLFPLPVPSSDNTASTRRGGCLSLSVNSVRRE